MVTEDEHAFLSKTHKEGGDGEFGSIEFDLEL